MSTQLLVLDLGLAQPRHGRTLGEVAHGGQIVKFSTDATHATVVLKGLHIPSGIVYDKKTQRLYITCMGFPPLNDGAVVSCRLDGSDPQFILANGQVHTPKQLALDAVNEKLYVCDREGLRIHRCNLDGTEHETLVETGDWQNVTEFADETKWCVGIAVSVSLGLFYWSQKGPPKGNRGRIFCAPIESWGKREPICLLDNLPEPVDLQMDETTSTLFWTDRGDLPHGRSVNRVRLDKSGTRPLAAQPDSTPGLSYQVLVQRLHEPIGLSLDASRSRWFVADLGGTIWSFDYDGKDQKLEYQHEDFAFSGIVVTE